MGKKKSVNFESNSTDHFDDKELEAAGGIELQSYHTEAEYVLNLSYN